MQSWPRFDGTNTALKSYMVEGSRVHGECIRLSQAKVFSEVLGSSNPGPEPPREC